MTDIIEIKKCFSTLRQLKVKEVVLNEIDWHNLKEHINKYCDDGGSHNYQSQFDRFPELIIFGVRVKHEKDKV